jgi:hypothetical protein
MKVPNVAPWIWFALAIILPTLFLLVRAVLKSGRAWWRDEAADGYWDEAWFLLVLLAALIYGLGWGQRYFPSPISLLSRLQ